MNYLDIPSAQKALKELHGSRIADGRVMHLSLQAPRAMRAAVKGMCNEAAGALGSQ